MNIIPLPAFRDNYIWLLHDGRSAVVVDPGDAHPVKQFLAREGLSLVAILITHHHADHIGGLAELRASAAVPVYGPAGENISGISHPVAEGDTVSLDAFGVELSILDIPGHTAGHIAYYAAALGAVFCGDTLFSAGCGRLFEGTAPQLAASLAKLAALPDDTRVYCTHEYTLANLAFARVAEPDNAERDAWASQCEALRAANEPTLPSTIGREKAINPFLRCDRPGVVHEVAARTGTAPSDPVACFAALRAWKDVF